jgi:hypothetical protein
MKTECQQQPGAPKPIKDNKVFIKTSLTDTTTQQAFVKALPSAPKPMETMEPKSIIQLEQELAQHTHELLRYAKEPGHPALEDQEDAGAFKTDEQKTAGDQEEVKPQDQNIKPSRHQDLKQTKKQASGVYIACQ